MHPPLPTSTNLCPISFNTREKKKNYTHFVFTSACNFAAERVVLLVPILTYFLCTIPVLAWFGGACSNRHADTWSGGRMGSTVRPVSLKKTPASRENSWSINIHMRTHRHGKKTLCRPLIPDHCGDAHNNNISSRSSSISDKRSDKLLVVAWFLDKICLMVWIITKHFCNEHIIRGSAGSPQLATKGGHKVLPTHCFARKGARGGKRRWDVSPRFTA